MPTVRIYISDDLRAKLKTYAKEKGSTMRKELEKAILKHCKIKKEVS